MGIDSCDDRGVFSTYSTLFLGLVTAFGSIGNLKLYAILDGSSLIVEMVDL